MFNTKPNPQQTWPKRVKLGAPHLHLGCDLLISLNDISFCPPFMIYLANVSIYVHVMKSLNTNALHFTLGLMVVELVVFGVLSLLMGHFTIFVAKICIKSSVFSTRYYPCIPETTSAKSLEVVQHMIISNYSKYAPLEHQDFAVFHARKYCDEVINLFTY